MSTGSTSAALPNAGTASARRGAAAPAADAAGHQAAWQREMERAQMATWFKPPVAASTEHAGARAGAGPVASARHAARAAMPGEIGPATGLPPAVAMQPPASLVAGVPTTGVLAIGAPVQAASAPLPIVAGLRSAPSAVAGAEPPAPAIDAVRRAGGALRAASPAVTEADAEMPSEDAAEAARAQPAHEADAQAPLRLHEEATAEGRAVWIAMRADDDALAALLPRIVADLQRDMQQLRGERLHQVVCNGRMVWREGVFMAAGDAAAIPGRGAGRSVNVFDSSFQTKGA